MNILKYIDLNNYLDMKYYSYSKDEIIHHEYDRCDYVSLVIEGIVKIVSYSYNGKEIVYNIINKGELFGHNLIASSEPFYKGNVIASENVKIACISLKTLILMLSNNSAFLKDYLKEQANEQINSNIKIKLLSFDLIYDRFMFFMDVKNKSYTYESITSFATILNVKRESLSRLLSKLVKDKIITINNKKITLAE